MEQTRDQTQCQQPAQPTTPSEMEFDISRTFLVLTATLVLPVYLALSVVSYSMLAIY